MSTAPFPHYDIDTMAAFVPAMNKSDFAALKSSLETEGYKGDPILLRMKEGKLFIVDGRNRYLACKELGIDLSDHVRIVEWDDDRAKREVWRRNIVRRQATRSDVAAALIAFGGTTIKDVAKISGVSERTAHSINTRISNNPEVRAEIIERAGSGESTHDVLRPGVTPEVKAERARERIMKSDAQPKVRPWNVDIDSKIADRFEVYAYASGYTTAKRALNALLQKIGNAAVEGKVVDITMRNPT